jgi:hypothetical protein
MKHRQHNRTQFFISLYLILALNPFGSFAYAGLKSTTKVLDSIESEYKTPDLRGFSDEQMKKIFRDIAKGNRNEDSEPFLKRIQNHIEQTQVLDRDFDLARAKHLQKEHSGNKVDAIPDIAHSIYNDFIKADQDHAISNFSNLIYSLHYLGATIKGENAISPHQKQTLFQNLSENTWHVYSTRLEQNEMSLKDALIKKIEHENPSTLSWLAMTFWNVSNVLNVQTIRHLFSELF